MGARADGSPQARHGRGTCWTVGDVWRCRIQVKGQKVYGSGKTEAIARADMNKAVRALERGEKPVGRGIPHTIGSAAISWLTALKFTAKAPGTLYNYVSLYRTWLGVLPPELDARKKRAPPVVDIGRSRLATFGPEQRRAWWVAMDSHGASRATIRNADAVLTGLLRANKRLGIHAEVIDRDVIPRPTVDRPPRRRPDAAEMLRLIAHCTVDWTEDASPREPYSSVFWLKVFTACRVGELRGFHWGDIDEIRGGVNVRVQMDEITKALRDTKGHQQRYIPLGPEAMAILKAHKERQREQGLPTGPGDLVFLHRRYPRWEPSVISSGAIEWAFMKARDAAGLSKDLTPHCLRHGSAMLSLRSGTDLVTLQRKLGHKDLATTAIYLEADGALAQGDATRLGAALRRTPKPIEGTG